MSSSTLLSLWLDYGNHLRPINSNIALRIGSGSATAPSYTFINDSSTGIYLGAVGTLSFATSSGVRMSMSSTAISIGVPIWAFDAISLYLAGRVADGASAIGIILDNKITLTTSGAKLVSIRNNGVERTYIDYLGNHFAPDGTQALPSYSFASDTDTGIYSGGANNISFTTGGVVRCSIGTSVIYMYNPLYSAAGSSFSIYGRQLDNASSIGIILDNTVTLTQAGAKLLSIRNNTVEKAYIDKNGGFVTLGGMIQGRKGTDIASANNATLTIDGNYFNVTGNTQINTLSATGVQAGTIITLQFNSNPVVKHNTAGTGAPFYLSGGVDYNPSAGNTLTLVYDGTYWREISRS
jgi:hypothetical protein